MIHLVLDDELCFILHGTNSAPLPCGSCAPSFSSLGSCTSLGSVLDTFVTRSSALCSTLVCAALGSWSCLGHPQPPDRSQHGCTVGVTGTHPCGPPPRQDGAGTRAPALSTLDDELRFQGDVDYRRVLLQEWYEKFDLAHEEILLDGTARSVRNEETLRDRWERPDNINSQEVARPPFLVHCWFRCQNLHSLRHKNKLVNQIVLLQ